MLNLIIRFNLKELMFLKTELNGSVFFITSFNKKSQANAQDL
jgi:hypothetical protein